MTLLPLLLCLLALPAWSADIRAVDADTLKIDGVRHRLAAISAPELNGQCEAEIRLAWKGTGYVEGLLLAARELDVPIITTDTGKRDRYGRPLIYARVFGRDLGEMLIERKLARRWNPKDRKGWC